MDNNSARSPFFSMTGTGAFWDGSIPNPILVGSDNPSLSIPSTRPEASAAGAGDTLHDQDLGPVPVVSRGGGYSYTIYCYTYCLQVSQFLRFPESRTWSVHGC